MVTGQLFSGDDTLSEKFFRATSDRVVGPVTRSLYTYDMHATSHAARDIVQVELPQGPDQHFCGVALKRSCALFISRVPRTAEPLARFPSDLDGTLTGTRRRSSFMSPSRSGAMRSSGPAAKGTFDDLSASRERGPDFVPVGPPITVPYAFRFTFRLRIPTITIN